DACLAARLPETPGEPLRELSEEEGTLVETTLTASLLAADAAGEPPPNGWLPSSAVAVHWSQYVADTAVSDETPPPAPTDVRIENGALLWTPHADLESGIRAFFILQNGKRIAQIPEKPQNPRGRKLFQGLQYSDTPLQPLIEAKFPLPADAPPDAVYTVRTVNTVGLLSEPAGIGR
ncbi:MAG: hypothetical protein AAF907_09695, partial [Planctomycetota bacterium]